MYFPQHCEVNMASTRIRFKCKLTANFLFTVYSIFTYNTRFNPHNNQMRFLRRQYSIGRKQSLLYIKSIQKYLKHVLMNFPAFTHTQTICCMSKTV